MNRFRHYAWRRIVTRLCTALRTRIVIVQPSHDIAILHKEPPTAYCLDCSNGYGEPFVFDDYCALCGHAKVEETAS